MTKIQAYAVSRGVAVPDPIPDPWLDDITISPELENELNSMTEELKPYQGLVAGELSGMVVAYLRQHVDALRERRPSWTG